MNKQILDRVNILIKNIHDLREKCIPEYKLKLEYLTIFSKDANDYEYLQNELKQLGEEKEANNGKKYTLYNPIYELEENITRRSNKAG